MFRCSRRVLNFLIRTNDNVSLNRLFSRGRNECDRCQSLRFQGNGLVAQEVGECKDGLRVVDYETEIGRFTTEILDTFRFDGASKCYRKILRISYKDCYQRGSPCQDPAGNRTARRPPDHRKETQTAVVWSCLPFIRSGQNHLARYSERGKKTRQTEDKGKWTGLEFAKSQRAVENRKEWRKVVAKSSVVPQRPSRLGIGES